VIKIGSGGLLAFLFPLLVLAQQGTVVSSSVDRNKLEVDDTLTLTVTVQSSESVDIDEPRVPGLSGFDLVQKWDNTAVQQSLVQTSSGMDFKTIRKREFHYAFQAKAPGHYSLDAFEVVVNGKLFKTEPIVIEVFAAGQAPPSAQKKGGSGNMLDQEDEDEYDALMKQQEDIFNQLLQGRSAPPGSMGGGLPNGPSHSARSQTAEPQYRSMPADPNDAFFIQLEVDKTSVYEGEQITATWYLLTRGQMESLDRVKFPDLKGFWKEIIEENPQIQFTDEIINGIPYKKALLASHALFPIKAGKALIDEFTVKSRIRTPSRFGFGRAYDYSRSSKRLEIQVKPLPNEGRPANFTGAVGQFNVTSQVEGTQFPVSQPFSYKIRFEGQGNAKAIDLPAIQWPDGVEVYDTKNDSKFFKDGNSYKEFEVLLIPRKEGPLEIPGVHFSFFNPKTGKYEQKETESVRVNITPAAAGAGASAKASDNFMGSDSGKKAEAAPKTLPSLIESSLLVKQNSGLGQALSVGSASARASGLWSLWGVVMALLAAIMGGFGVYELRPQTRALSLRRKLDQAWKKVDAAFAVGHMKQTGIEIVNSFNLVLSEVSSHKSETQEIEKMLENLDPSKRTRLREMIMACYEEAQLLGFAPDAAIEKLLQKDRVKELVQNSRKVLNEICE
jgi:hypothetical protein